MLHFRQAVLGYCQMSVAGSKRKARLVCSVEIRASGQKQIIALCQCPDLCGHFRCVLAVVGLDTHQAGLLQLADQSLQPLIPQLVLERMSKNRNSVEAQQKFHSHFRCDLLSGDKKRTVIADVFVKGLLHAADGTLFQQKLRHIGAGDNGIRIIGHELLIRDGKPRIAHHPAHLLISQISCVGELLHLFLKFRIPVIVEEAYDVDILFVIFGGELDSGDHFNACAGGGLHGFVDACRGVMIREGKSREPLFCGKRNQLRRCKCTV